MAKTTLAHDYLAKYNKLARITYENAQMGAKTIKNHSQKSERLNQEITKYYQEILHEICYLASVLGLTTNTQLAHLFQYLLVNGYLSVEHRYVPSSKLAEVPFAGINIMTGKGDSVSQSGMLHNIFETLHREAYVIAVGHLESIFRTYTTQVVYGMGKNSYYTFDSARGLEGSSDKHLGATTPDGQKLKFSRSLSIKLDNTLSILENNRNDLTKENLKKIKQNLVFSTGLLRPVDTNYLYQYFEQNRTIIDEFYRRQYLNIAHVADLASKAR